MFETLTGKLQKVFRTLQGYGKLSEGNVAEALGEVRTALLEADVQFQVAGEFVERVKARSLGREVLDSVTPGQQVIKIIHDELVELLGSAHQGLNLSGDPARIVLVGLHGSGKTTTAGKLALWLRKQGRRPVLAACDVYRPAAIDQLKTLGAQIEVPVFSLPGVTDVPRIAGEAGAFATGHRADAIIYDTAGRLQVDEPLVRELTELRARISPHEVLLVADAALGQQAVDVARVFDQATGLTGIILSRLDGDARGGAALSMRWVTQKPVKFAGVGEKPADLEPFHPERMATRILGMGDVVSLVEKAQETFDAQQAEDLEKKMRRGEMDLDDLLEQVRMVKKMGPLENLLGMLPGIGSMPALASNPGLMAQGEKQMKKTEAIILSMTPGERRFPHLINARRRQRIARGSGVTVTDVNQLLRQFEQMRKMMKKMGKMKKMFAGLGGKMPPGQWPM